MIKRALRRLLFSALISGLFPSVAKADRDPLTFGAGFGGMVGPAGALGSGHAWVGYRTRLDSYFLMAGLELSALTVPIVNPEGFVFQAAPTVKFGWDDEENPLGTGPGTQIFGVAGLVVGPPDFLGLGARIGVGFTEWQLACLGLPNTVELLFDRYRDGTFLHGRVSWVL